MAWAELPALAVLALLAATIPQLLLGDLQDTQVGLAVVDLPEVVRAEAAAALAESEWEVGLSRKTQFLTICISEETAGLVYMDTVAVEAAEGLSSARQVVGAAPAAGATAIACLARLTLEGAQAAQSAQLPQTAALESA